LNIKPGRSAHVLKAKINHVFAQVAYRPRWWIGIVLFWALLAALSYSWQYKRLEADALEMATLRGRLVFSMVQITRAWNAGHGGVYAAITPESPANPYLEHPDKFGKTQQGRALTLINPAYMTRQIDALIETRTDLKIHLTSLNPINPGNAADAWEREALESFLQGVKERTVFSGSGAEATFRYMAPLYVEQSCLSCHAKQGYKLGDVRGGLSVSQPASYIVGIIDSQKSSLLQVHLAAFLLLSLISLLSLWQNRMQILSLEKARDEHQKTAEELAKNIEELKRARNQLLQSEKMASIGQLASGVAHEINNPIGFVNSNIGTLERYVADMTRVIHAYQQAENTLADVARAEIEVLKREVDLPYMLDDIPKLLSESQDGLARVKRIILDLKDFSRASDQNWKRVNLEQCMDSTLNVAWNEIKYKAEVKKDYAGLPEVVCMPSQISQVFLNLLVNAAQSIDSKGIITIRTGVEGNQVWIEVADTGKGISPEFIGKIFDPFFTTKPVGQGTGLGLSVSYGIVQKHGGHFEVKSEPGQGTTMRVWLPKERGLT